MSLAPSPPAPVLRLARSNDAAAIRGLYTPYVEATAVSFETDIPSEDSFREKIEAGLGAHPWVVACDVDDGATLLGYAYAGPHRTRAAYRWCVEVSV